MTTSERIILLIKNNNLKPSVVADALNISRSNLTRWKQENYVPSAEHIITLAKYFNVTTDWILTGKDNFLDKNKPSFQFSPEEHLKNLLSLEERLLIEHYRDMSNEKKLETLREAAKAAVDINNIYKENGIALRVYDLPASAGFGNYLGDDEPYSILQFNNNDIPNYTEFGIRISGDSMYPKIEDGSIVWIKQQLAINNGEIGIFILDGDAYCKQLNIDDNKNIVSLVSINKKYSPIVINEYNNLRTVGKVLGSSLIQ